jgi:hypothetical protein
VETVSASLYIEGLHVIIRQVLELPPKDSSKTLVSLLSRYGMCADLPSVRVLITSPREVKLLFIFFASSKVCPLALVFPTFSEPAKSTKKSFPVLVEKSELFLYVIVIIKMEWLRDDYLFMSVTPIALLSLPVAMIS